MRLARFAYEFYKLKAIGWPWRRVPGMAWRRSHPQAKERFDHWLKTNFS
jgi:hypothetical protein